MIFDDSRKEFAMITAQVFFAIPMDTLPQITLANSVTIDLPYVHFGRTPVEYILYIIIDGVMYLTEDGIEYTLKPGDFILLDPSRYHFGRKGSRCFYYYIHFTAANITELHQHPEEYQKLLSKQRVQAATLTDMAAPELSHLLLPKYFHLPGRTFVQLQHDARNLLLSFHNPIEFHVQTSNLMLLSLFIKMQQYLTNHTLGENKHEHSTLPLEIIAYLKIYYPEKITGERLEKHFYKNFDYINRVFKKAMGKTIFQWLNDYRILEAKKLLQSHFYTHRQIAEKTGFSNEFYFSRVFKKVTGSTPSEYQKEFTD